LFDKYTYDETYYDTIPSGVLRYLILADAIVIADVINKESRLPRSETIGIVDSFSKTSEFALSPTDTLTIADIITKTLNLIEQDTVTLADAISKGISISETDALTIADIFSREAEFIRSYSDTITIADLISRSTSLSFADAILVSDCFRRIMGASNVSMHDTVATDYFHLSQFTADATGEVRQIRINSTANTNIKIAIYEDSAGEPGDLLNAVNTSCPIVIGWNNITFPATVIVQGTDYWIGFNSG
jgi:hypothetical protein